MKFLTFSSKDKEVYELLYEALGIATIGYKGSQVRLVSKVYDKLESIGKIKDGVDGERGLHTLRNMAIMKLDLEDTEYDLLIKAFESTEWTGLGARKAATVYHWLDSLTKNKDSDGETS